MKTSTILQILQDYAEGHGKYFSLCGEGYAEPGYSDPESGVIAFGNWNPDSWDRPIPKEHQVMPRMSEILEKLGAAIEWSDEWKTCYACEKAVRTSPDSYSWRRSYWQEEDGTILCEECVQENPEGMLESLEGNDNSCLTFNLDLGANGYRLLESDFENGVYGGQSADPREIGKSLRKLGVYRYLFVLDSSGQFDIDFSVWVHEDEWEKIDEEKWGEAKKEGADPAISMKNALADASRKMDELPDDGRIKVASCQPDGTAKIGLVTPQEFVDGKALDCVKD